MLYVYVIYIIYEDILLAALIVYKILIYSRYK